MGMRLTLFTLLILIVFATAAIVACDNGDDETTGVFQENTDDGMLDDDDDASADDDDDDVTDDDDDATAESTFVNNDVMWTSYDNLLPASFEDATAYIDGLNEEKFGGHEDWRLPTNVELPYLYDSWQEEEMTDCGVGVYTVAELHLSCDIVWGHAETVGFNFNLGEPESIDDPENNENLRVLGARSLTKDEIAFYDLMDELEQAEQQDYSE